MTEECKVDIFIGDRKTTPWQVNPKTKPLLVRVGDRTDISVRLNDDVLSSLRQLGAGQEAGMEVKGKTYSVLIKSVEETFAVFSIFDQDWKEIKEHKKC